MEDCRENIGLVPLRKVVNASIIDTYGDINREEQLRTHWAARGLKLLYNQILPNEHHRVMLTINKNTNTATLPADFHIETFVGIIVNGEKVPVSKNNELTNDCSITTQIEKECPRCKQDKAICESLEITETDKQIIINGNPYNQTITKKLYPNGDYYLETSTPVFNTQTSGIDYPITKKFIVNFALNPCGCLAKTPENDQNLSTYCPDTYNCYCTSCSSCNSIKAGYKIFEDVGLIQFSSFYGDSAYLEYNGFITKIGGTYMVPEVAFETLVEFTKYMSVAGKPNITPYEKSWYKKNYTDAKDDLFHILGRVSLSTITDTLNSSPKFDIDYRSNSLNQKYF